jgi:hypothetical protein
VPRCGGSCASHCPPRRGHTKSRSVKNN